MNDLAHDTPMHLEIGDDVVASTDPETGEPCTRRVWLLAARADGSRRFWPDFVHHRAFDSRELAERTRERDVRGGRAGRGVRRVGRRRP